MSFEHGYHFFNDKPPPHGRECVEWSNQGHRTVGLIDPRGLGLPGGEFDCLGGYPHGVDLRVTDVVPSPADTCQQSEDDGSILVSHGTLAH